MVLVEQLPPAGVAEQPGLLAGADNIGEQNGGEAVQVFVIAGKSKKCIFL